MLVVIAAPRSSLIASSVRFRMRRADGSGNMVINRDGVIDGTSRVSLAFQAPELDTPGTYSLEASLVYVDGRETVPTVGYVKVVVIPTLE